MTADWSEVSGIELREDAAGPRQDYEPDIGPNLLILSVLLQQMLPGVPEDRA